MPKNSDFLLNMFLSEQQGHPILLILKGGYHLKGILKDFDPGYVQIETTDYSPDKKTPRLFLQNKHLVSGFSPVTLKNTTVVSSNNDSHDRPHLLIDFLRENKGKPITMIVEGGYHLKGTLKDFDTGYIKMSTSAYSPDRYTTIDFIQNKHAVSGFVSGVTNSGR